MGPFNVALPLAPRLAPLTGRDALEVVDDLLPVTIGETELRARMMNERDIGITMALFHSGHWSSVDNLIRKKLVNAPNPIMGSPMTKETDIMNLRFSGKVALVTGAASGLGKAIGH